MLFGIVERVGNVVGILGMGGLGHLGIQFAAKMGFNTVAIGRARDKEEELMKKLGARQYIDNKSQNAVEELNELRRSQSNTCNCPQWKGDD